MNTANQPKRNSYVLFIQPINKKKIVMNYFYSQSTNIDCLSHLHPKGVPPVTVFFWVCISHTPCERTHARTHTRADTYKNSLPSSLPLPPSLSLFHRAVLQMLDEYAHKIEQKYKGVIIARRS
jgi:hypothetical protein